MLTVSLQFFPSFPFCPFLSFIPFPPTLTQVRRIANTLSAKAKTQSVSMVEYLGKRPLHFDNSIMSNTNAATLSINSEEVYERLWKEISQTGVLGDDMLQTIWEGWEEARNRMIAGAVLGAGGSSVGM